MNKRGAEILTVTVILIIFLVVLSLSGLLYSSIHLKNGSFFWEDYYAKEISKVIDLASPGDELTIDVQNAMVLAHKNGLKNLNNIVRFDGANNEVIVRLGENKETRFEYFNDVSIVNPRIEFADDGENNVLKFSLVSRESLG
ncbi:hypothetical protein COU54_04570 [Candidatus Pacearchaeota archaeon CG10_big_fil_rev_8_21_14_0_10_31_24]|nr:MAG: hypothetical protein COU54_04570 [Candidatus Pacearchaeota archaeon CG10_big_fil_rev_8_21_14_0_10_31_24]